MRNRIQTYPKKTSKLSRHIKHNYSKYPKSSTRSSSGSEKVVLQEWRTTVQAPQKFRNTLVPKGLSCWQRPQKKRPVVPWCGFLWVKQWKGEMLIRNKWWFLWENYGKKSMKHFLGANHQVFFRSCYMGIYWEYSGDIHGIYRIIYGTYVQWVVFVGRI